MNHQATEATPADESLLKLIEKTAGMPRQRNKDQQASWLSLLNSHLADGACVDGPKHDGELLRLAIVSKYMDVLRVLLEGGANPNARVMAPTGFYTGVRTVGHAKELLERCQKVDKTTKAADLDQPFMSTPLHEAVLTGSHNERTIISLIAFGANTGATNAWSMAPLDVAYSLHRSEITELLSRPLHAAVRACKDVGLCQLLLSRGHSEEEKDHSGTTPTALAKLMGLTEITALFDAHKASRAVDALLATLPHQETPTKAGARP